MPSYTWVGLGWSGNLVEAYKIICKQPMHLIYENFHLENLKFSSSRLPVYLHRIQPYFTADDESSPVNDSSVNSLIYLKFQIFFCEIFCNLILVCELDGLKLRVAFSRDTKSRDKESLFLLIRQLA